MSTMRCCCSHLNHIHIVQLCHSRRTGTVIMILIAGVAVVVATPTAAVVVIVVVYVQYVVVHVNLLMVNERHLAFTTIQTELLLDNP